ncbi:6309_t:CDS:2, partial [Dentiscutata erythropus]
QENKVYKLARKCGEVPENLPTILQNSEIAALVLKYLKRDDEMPALLIDWNDSGFNDTATPNLRNGVAGQTKAAIVADLVAGDSLAFAQFYYSFSKRAKNQAGVPNVYNVVIRINKVSPIIALVLTYSTIQVRLTNREDLNLTIVWATGVYPFESEDHELDLVLFVPIKDDEKDSNTQAIFVKDEYYCIAGKVVPKIFNNNFKLKITVLTSTHITIRRDLGSNRCPLKVLLVGVAQDIMREFNKEDAIVNVLVDVPFASKRKVSDSFRLPIVDLTTIDSNSLKHKRVVDGCTEYVVSSISGCCSYKHVRVDDEADDYVEYVDSDCSDNKCISKSINKCAERSSECSGNVIFEDKDKFSYDNKMNKGKEKKVQPTVHNTRHRTKF